MRYPEFASERCTHWSAPIWLVIVFAVLLVLPRSLVAETPDRIVSIGGSVTEIIYALGEEDRLVARDTTSVYPNMALKLPDVGYIRALAAEGVLSVRPTTIITEDGAGPPETISVLQEAAIPMITIPDGYTKSGILAKILAVGVALNVPEKAHVLARKVETDLDRVNAAIKTKTGGPKRV